jgi:hypothetical protein
MPQIEKKEMRNNDKFEAPVLLITFNRYKYTYEVLEKIRRAKIKKLYLFNDGPRKNNNIDVMEREKIKNIIGDIDWDCEVNTYFAKENLGCGKGPFSAISWAFKNEEKLIILEDDCVPAISFFNYCDTLLNKYDDDERIWLISGSNFMENYQYKADYHITRHAHTLGWGTWKRCWMQIDLKMNKFPSFINKGGFKNVFFSKYEYKIYNYRYQNFFSRKINIDNVWDYQFSFSRHINNGLAIIPRKNLIKNIGITGTHNKKRKSFHFRTIDENFYINYHPDDFLLDRKYEKKYAKYYLKMNFKTKIKSIIKNKFRNAFL